MLYLADYLPISFRVDDMGIIFAVVISIVFLCAAIYSKEYMKHEGGELRYYIFYSIVYVVLMGLCFAGNLITYYMFYELMTLTSLPLVLHNLSHESIMAGLKYLLYSLVGAYCVLFGLFFSYKYTNTLEFVWGGTLNAQAYEHTELMLLVTFMMIIGFSVKGGMFPMHAWLPTAHPVAPSPASAALSGVIVKAGVLGIIRVLFYVVGPDFIRGTWVQTVLLILSLTTVFMGSMLAFREKIFKKRLAYSTVSQVSYILFGLFTLNDVAASGSLLHVIGHAFTKCALFLIAGALIMQTGIKNVDGYRGIGKKLPVTMWSYTFCAMALIGIPPTGGFMSKWYLCVGALESGISVFAYLGPVVLLTSALLTAGYLLPITMQAFFPGEEPISEQVSKCKPLPVSMVVPIVILTVLAVVVGMFPNGIVNVVTGIFNGFM